MMSLTLPMTCHSPIRLYLLEDSTREEHHSACLVQSPQNPSTVRSKPNFNFKIRNRQPPSLASIGNRRLLTVFPKPSRRSKTVFPKTNRGRKTVVIFKARIFRYRSLHPETVSFFLITDGVSVSSSWAVIFFPFLSSSP